MIHIDLGNPCPRPYPLVYTAFGYMAVAHRYLPTITKSPKRQFFDVVENRASMREYGPLTNVQLSEFLWYTEKTRQNKEINGLKWEHRPTPSAGGLHPIDIFIFNRRRKKYLELYRPLSHSLAKLEVENQSALNSLDEEINQVIPSKGCCAIIYGAQFGLTNAKYKNPDSLVWRDAGTITGVSSLVAEALRLNACPLGITGEPWLSSALNSHGQVVGVGGLLIGRRL